MKSKGLLLIAFMLIILTLGVVSAEDKMTVMADESLGASGGNSSQPLKTFADVQSIVDSANENDVIELAGYYEGTGSPITIKKSLTINGNNAVLDAKSSSRIINVEVSDSTSKVFLNDITFKNAYATRKGGAITGGYEPVFSAAARIPAIRL